jgi:membrane protein
MSGVGRSRGESGMKRWTFMLTRAAKVYSAEHCSSFAAAIAYYALLALFPLAVFAVSLAGYLLRGDPQAQERIVNLIMDNLPLDSQSGRQQLHDQLAAVTQGRVGLGLLGLLGTAYSASALFGAVRIALSAVFNVQRPRPLVQGKLLDLGMTLALGLLLFLSLGLTAVVTVVLRLAQDLFGGLAPLMSVLVTIGQFLVVPAVTAVICLILYTVVPPGAVLAAVAFEVLKLGFAQYVAHFGNFDAVYGTLGFVIVFLLFAYLSAQIVLFGATVTRAYSEAQAGIVTPAQPTVPKRPAGLAERVAAIVKGLFVTPEPRHAEPPPSPPIGPSEPRADEQARAGPR